MQNSQQLVAIVKRIGPGNCGRVRQATYALVIVYAIVNYGYHGCVLFVCTEYPRLPKYVGLFLPILSPVGPDKHPWHSW